MTCVGLNNTPKIPVSFVIEDADWAIKNVGENIKREIDLINPNKFEVTTNPAKIIKNG